MWILALKTGEFTDKGGNPRSFTRSDLERIARAYDPRSHEAPVIIGQPRDDAPAYGWVEALQANGDELLAKVNITVPEFAKILREGLYRKKSISLYPDGSLRYLGIVGATAPSISGLGMAKFKEGCAMVYEFQAPDGVQEPSAGQILGRKISDILANPPQLNQFGERITGQLTYREAMHIVLAENPELTARYIEEIQEAQNLEMTPRLAR
jgi:hypothetical protein